MDMAGSSVHDFFFGAVYGNNTDGCLHHVLSSQKRRGKNSQRISCTSPHAGAGGVTLTRATGVPRASFEFVQRIHDPHRI